MKLKASTNSKKKHLKSLVCGIEQQFNPILSQVQYEVMAKWCLVGEINRYLISRHEEGLVLIN